MRFDRREGQYGERPKKHHVRGLGTFRTYTANWFRGCMKVM